MIGNYGHKKKISACLRALKVPPPPRLNLHYEPVFNNNWSCHLLFSYLSWDEKPGKSKKRAKNLFFYNHDLISKTIIKISKSIF